MFEHYSLVDGLLARVEGPMSLRLIMQPLVALIFSIRDGVKDAEQGSPPFFWAIFTDPDHRKELVANGWKSIGKVFIIAVVLDLVFQYSVFSALRPIGALLAGSILALLPYIVLRGPVNRLICYLK